jgi:hypothetical protein
VPLGGKWRTVDWAGREWYVASRLLQGCSTRLCRLRTNALAPETKYWMYWSHAGDMCPISLVACSSIDVWLEHTSGYVGRETETGPVGHSAGLRGGIGSTFSREQWICSTLLNQSERLPCMGTARRKRTHGICGLAWEAYVSCWLGFPCRVYIDSNRRDSRIWVAVCSWLSSHS